MADTTQDADGLSAEQSQKLAYAEKKHADALRLLSDAYDQVADEDIEYLLKKYAGTLKLLGE